MKLVEEEIKSCVADALALLPPLHRMTLEKLYGLNGSDPVAALPIVSSYLEQDQELLETIASDALRMLRRSSHNSSQFSYRAH